MEKFQKTEKFEDLEPEGVFEASKEAFEELEMEIIKERSFAFFLQAQTKKGQVPIDANLLVNAFQNQLTLTVTSEVADRDQLESFSDEYLECLQSHLTV